MNKTVDCTMCGGSVTVAENHSGPTWCANCLDELNEISQNAGDPEAEAELAHALQNLYGGDDENDEGEEEWKGEDDADPIAMEVMDTRLAVEPGAVITFGPGAALVSTSPMTGKVYFVRKAKYLGNGQWQAILKEEVQVQKSPCPDCGGMRGCPLYRRAGMWLRRCRDCHKARALSCPECEDLDIEVEWDPTKATTTVGGTPGRARCRWCGHVWVVMIHD